MQGKSTCTASLGFSRAKQRMPMLSWASGMCRKPSEAAAASWTCTSALQPLRYLQPACQPQLGNHATAPHLPMQAFDKVEAHQEMASTAYRPMQQAVPKPSAHALLALGQFHYI